MTTSTAAAEQHEAMQAPAVTRPKRVVTKRQGGISLTRFTLCCLTFGLAYPFVGVRRVKKIKTRTR